MNASVIAMAADADGFISVSDTRRGRRQKQRVDANGQKKNKKQGQRRGQGAQAAVASPLLRTEDELLEYSPAEVSRLVAAVQQLRYVCMFVCMYVCGVCDRPNVRGKRISPTQLSLSSFSLFSSTFYAVGQARAQGLHHS